MPLLDFATIPLWLQILAYVYFVGGIIAAIYITHPSLAFYNLRSQLQMADFYSYLLQSPCFSKDVALEIYQDRP